MTSPRETKRLRYNRKYRRDTAATWGENRERYQSTFAAFDSAMRRFESSRPSQIYSRNIRYLVAVATFSDAGFMLRHFAKNFQAISTVAKPCRWLHATWTQHGTSRYAREKPSGL